MKQTSSKAVYAVVLGASVAALILAGCGGSGGSSGNAPPLKKPQFIAQANSICKQAETERNEALKDAANGEPELGELTDAALPSLQKMTEELGELGPPKGDKEEVETIVGAFEEGASEVEDNSTDPTAQISAFAEADKLAEEYGLTDCAI
jgi:hypothetical protein